jgi:hypothetical protein
MIKYVGRLISSLFEGQERKFETELIFSSEKYLVDKEKADNEKIVEIAKMNP